MCTFFHRLWEKRPRSCCLRQAIKFVTEIPLFNIHERNVNVFICSSMSQFQKTHRNLLVICIYCMCCVIFPVFNLPSKLETILRGNDYLVNSICFQLHWTIRCDSNLYHKLISSWLTELFNWNVYKDIVWVSASDNLIHSRWNGASGWIPQN